jgi:hypothetical protein
MRHAKQGCFRRLAWHVPQQQLRNRGCTGTAEAGACGLQKQHLLGQQQPPLNEAEELVCQTGLQLLVLDPDCGVFVHGRMLPWRASGSVSAAVAGWGSDRMFACTPAWLPKLQQLMC